MHRWGKGKWRFPDVAAQGTLGAIVLVDPSALVSQNWQVRERLDSTCVQQRGEPEATSWNDSQSRATPSQEPNRARSSSKASRNRAYRHGGISGRSIRNLQRALSRSLKRLGMNILRSGASTGDCTRTLRTWLLRSR